MGGTMIASINAVAIMARSSFLTAVHLLYQLSLN
jgi:hypothetical protein